MNLTTVNKKIKLLRDALDRVEGIHNRHAFVTIYGTAVTAAVSYNEESSYDSECHVFRDTANDDDDDCDLDEWLENFVVGAIQWIDKIPTKETRERNAFLRDLGHLIDTGKDVGIEVEFLNPLTAMMKTLSENVIEDKRLGGVPAE